MKLTKSFLTSNFCNSKFTLFLLPHKAYCETVERKFLLSVLTKMGIVLLVKKKVGARIFTHLKAVCKYVDNIDHRRGQHYDRGQ